MRTFQMFLATASALLLSGCASAGLKGVTAHIDPKSIRIGHKRPPLSEVREKLREKYETMKREHAMNEARLVENERYERSLMKSIETRKERSKAVTIALGVLGGIALLIIRRKRFRIRRR